MEKLDSSAFTGESTETLPQSRSLVRLSNYCRAALSGRDCVTGKSHMAFADTGFEEQSGVLFLVLSTLYFVRDVEQVPKYIPGLTHMEGIKKH